MNNTLKSNHMQRRAYLDEVEDDERSAVACQHAVQMLTRYEAIRIGLVHCETR